MSIAQFSAPVAGLPKSCAEIDALAVNTIRTLAMDAVQAADSGHPGTPMALAPVAYALWQRVLRYDPADPTWWDRDRFVLSNGHASMLLYSVLHLAGVKDFDRSGKPTGRAAITIDDIKSFRQLDSRCAGHPEYGVASGIETTTGPLGQGAATSVGMAMASGWLAARYNRPNFELFTHRVWAICGDGCFMEGITGEAASLAGHLRLANLCWIYDNNHITIEGKTSLAYSDDVPTRFRGYGWNVMHVSDANDIDAVAINCAAARESDRPTLIVLDSHIGWGSPNKQDTAAAHGEALGVEEIAKTKRFYNWPEDAKFLVPDGVRERFADGVGKRGAAARAAWSATWGSYRTKFPAEAAELECLMRHELPAGWDGDMPTFATDAKGVASRVSGGKALNGVAKRVPWLVGGSADLAPSTKTLIDGAGSIGTGEPGGRNVHFGIREHAMGAICNGMALSGLRAYGAGFLIFSDYMRGSIRLSALMEVPVTYVMTHDSIGLGEDGPTHQPIEQLLSLRAVPHLRVWRPGDARETVEAWRQAMLYTHGPSLLALSRQNLPTLAETETKAREGCARGGYVLTDCGCNSPQVILIGTGSELALCVSAQKQLTEAGIRARVVSLPCWGLFDAQDAAYRESVLPRAVTARVSVEASAAMGWERYVGISGSAIGMHSFGASAPIAALMKKFGFTVEAVVAAAKSQVSRS